METNPFDRLARRLRKPAIVALYISAPISLFAYAGMWALVVASWPMWLVVAALSAHFIAALGIASLLDNRKEKPRTQSRDPQP